MSVRGLGTNIILNAVHKPQQQDQSLVEVEYRANTDIVQGTVAVGTTIADRPPHRCAEWGFQESTRRDIIVHS